MSDAPKPCPKLEQIVREHVRDCPEDIGHVLAWALNIASGAQAIGMPSGPIQPMPDPDVVADVDALRAALARDDLTALSRESFAGWLAEFEAGRTMPLREGARAWVNVVMRGEGHGFR